MNRLPTIDALQNKVVVCGVKEGLFLGNLITCFCCNVTFSPSDFEKHTGSTRHRPWQNIFCKENNRSISYYREQLFENPRKNSHKKKKSHRKQMESYNNNNNNISKSHPDSEVSSNGEEDDPFDSSDSFQYSSSKERASSSSESFGESDSDPNFELPLQKVVQRRKVEADSFNPDHYSNPEDRESSPKQSLQDHTLVPVAASVKNINFEPNAKKSISQKIPRANQGKVPTTIKDHFPTTKKQHESTTSRAGTTSADPKTTKQNTDGVSATVSRFLDANTISILNNVAYPSGLQTENQINTHISASLTHHNLFQKTLSETRPRSAHLRYPVKKDQACFKGVITNTFDDDQRGKIDRIVSRKRSNHPRSETYYYVKWKGYVEFSWESRTHLLNHFFHKEISAFENLVQSLLISSEEFKNNYFLTSDSEILTLSPSEENPIGYRLSTQHPSRLYPSLKNFFIPHLDLPSELESHSTMGYHTFDSPKNYPMHQQF